MILRKWWAMRDSNSRHPRCKRGALPTELIALREAEALSAASVAVIYAYRQKTARAEWKIFSIFFPNSRHRRMPPGKSDVENLWVRGGRQRRGRMGQNMVEAEALPRHAGIFQGRFFQPVETIRWLSRICLQTCLTPKDEPRS